MRRVFIEVFLFVAAVWGLVAAALELGNVTHSRTVVIAIIGFTVVVALIFSSASIVIYFHSLRSGYPVFRTRSFICLRRTRISIDHNYRATIEMWRDFVFHAVPKKNELVDMLDTLPGFEFSDSDYKAFDSHIADRIAPRPNVMVLQWEPKRRIIPLVPYRHHTINNSPSLYGPDYFYHSIYFDRETGKVDFCLDAPAPFDEVFAFIMPRFVGSVSERNLIKYGLMSKHRKCAQPELSEHRKELLWTLERPQRGRIYVVAGIYEGQMDLLLKTHSLGQT